MRSPAAAAADLDDVAEVGWAANSLERSLRAALVQATAVGHLLMVGVLFASPDAEAHRAALAVAHLGVATLALLVLGGRVPLDALTGAR